MTTAFARRYLKLLPHRAVRYLRPYILPFFVVISLVVAVIFAFTLPGNSTQKIILGENIDTQNTFPSTPPPAISAKNVFILDQYSGQIIYSKSADEAIYPASTTKIVTGLVVLQSFPLDQIITVTQEYTDGQRVGFQAGEQITVENLLYALLIDSANDAAEIFAENYPGGRVAFVAAMNDYAQSQGLRHTYFKNPTGLDEDGHFSSASDLGRLAGIAMQNPLVSRIVSTENTVVSSIDNSQSHVIANTNELLGKVPGVLGIKTGFTDLAGQSLITLVNREGKQYIFVVMGSVDRFGETTELIEWAYSQ